MPPVTNLFPFPLNNQPLSLSPSAIRHAVSLDSLRFVGSASVPRRGKMQCNQLIHLFTYRLINLNKNFPLENVRKK